MNEMRIHPCRDNSDADEIESSSYFEVMGRSSQRERHLHVVPPPVEEQLGALSRIMRRLRRR